MGRWTKQRITEYADGCFAAAQERLPADPVWGAAPRLDYIPDHLDVTFYPPGETDGGEYCHFPRHLVFNYELLSYHGTACCEDLIAHEVAHAVVDAMFGAHPRAHGREWREIARILGSEATTRHRYTYDHIALKYPDRYFLYATDDETFYEWFTVGERKVDAERPGRKDAGFRVRCAGEGYKRMRYRPDLVRKVELMRSATLSHLIH